MTKESVGVAVRIVENERRKLQDQIKKLEGMKSMDERLSALLGALGTDGVASESKAMLRAMAQQYPYGLVYKLISELDSL
jgi:hypothetical protein